MRTFIKLAVTATLICCIASMIKAENISRPQSFGIAAGVDFGVGVQKSFQDFISKQFGVNFPAVRPGFGFAFNIQDEKKLSIAIGGNLRTFHHSKNDVVLDWLQSRASFDFVYDVVTKNCFRLSPFLGFAFSVNDLEYSDNRTLANNPTIPDLLVSSYKSLHLIQPFHYGLDVGVRCSFFLFDSVHLSAYVKWEQDFSKGNWRVQHQNVKDMPKFSGSGLAFGVMVGI